MSTPGGEITESGGGGRGRIFGLVYLFVSVAIVLALGKSYGILAALLALWPVFVVGNLFVVRKPFKQRMVDLAGASLVLLTLIAFELIRTGAFR